MWWTRSQKHSISIDFVFFFPELAEALGLSSRCPGVHCSSTSCWNFVSSALQSQSNQHLPLSQSHEEVAVFFSPSPVPDHAFERSVAQRASGPQASQDVRVAALSRQPRVRTGAQNGDRWP